jgi:hypothetical protein
LFFFESKTARISRDVFVFCSWVFSAIHWADRVYNTLRFSVITDFKPGAFVRQGAALPASNTLASPIPRYWQKAG